MRMSRNLLYLDTLTKENMSPDYPLWLNDPLVNQFLESRFQVATRESVLKFIEGASVSNSYLFGIFLQENSKHIGNIKLGPVSQLHRRGDIGLLIGDKRFWGKGIATQAIELVVEFAFNHLNLLKVTAGMYAPNLGSYRAFIKCGFSVVGVYKKHSFFNGEFVDQVILEKLKDV